MNNFFLTTGLDNFTGLPDGNQFFFSPATLQSTDTVTGGAAGTFIDELVMTAGGVVQASQFAGVTNMERLTISAADTYVELTNGLVAGSSAGFFGVHDGNAASYVDASAITAQPIAFFAEAGGDTFIGGSGNDSVFIAAFDLTSADTFQGGAGNDSLYLSSFFSFNADIFRIVPASAFTNVTGFENLFLGIGGNLVTLTDNLVAGTSIGYFSVTDSAASDIVDASGVTATPIVFFASAGSDTFKGGGGNDAVFIAPANLTSDDTLQGGAGADNLYLTAAGTVSASALTNVTGFEGISLSSSGNTVTLTNGLVSGAGYFSIHDGGGNDVVDASAVTATPIAFFEGAGTDTFTSGGGNDGVYVSVADLTSADSLQAGAGIDNLHLTTSGTVAGSAFTNVTGFEGLVLSGLGNNVTLTNGLVAGTSIGYFVVSDGAGNDTVDASGITNGTSVAIYGTHGGNETFTGGNGNDSFLFGSGQLTATDSVVGGGGTDTLWMTTAGTTSAADLAGVSGIEGVYQQNGGTFTLADGIAGAASLVAAGSGAVDTFDASAVTAYGVRFSGNGGADVLRGGSQDDTFFIGDSAFATIDGNGGTTDRITPTAASQVFDLTANAGKISDLEVIDLTRATAASLNLVGTDITVVNSSGNSLYVVGDSDDTVSAGSGFTLIASGLVNNAVAAGHTFDEYQHSSGSLLFVDSGVLLV